MLRRAEGHFTPNPADLTTGFLAARGLIDTPANRTPFNWNAFIAGLMSRDLTPGQIADLTLPEALLYTLGNESQSISLRTAIARVNAIKSLSIEDRIQFARLKTS